MSISKFNIREFLEKRRDGLPLSDADISGYIAGVTNEDVNDAQIAAYAMATVLNPLLLLERVSLTKAMRDSGKVLQWDLDGPIVDKHSTGGVGDTVSLILAPVMAACGTYVPMISGRGLGHTGGTLDKLASIQGVDPLISIGAMQKLVRECGCAMVGQTSELTPADRRIYAVRDVTSTVESIDLITASILSKKLAANLDNLLLDVKVGRGAFSKDIATGKKLAESLKYVGTELGCNVNFALTNMDVPLANSIGNAVEVRSALAILWGADKGSRLFKTSVELCAILLAEARPDLDAAAAYMDVLNAISSGKAAEIFEKMIAGIGGPTDIMAREDEYLPDAAYCLEITAPYSGYIMDMDPLALAKIVLELGGGRQNPSDKIDPAVGISDLLEIGNSVEKGQRIASLHCQDKDTGDGYIARVLDAIAIGDKKLSADIFIVED